MCLISCRPAQVSVIVHSIESLGSKNISKSKSPKTHKFKNAVTVKVTYLTLFTSFAIVSLSPISLYSQGKACNIFLEWIKVNRNKKFMVKSTWQNLFHLHVVLWHFCKPLHAYQVRSSFAGTKCHKGRRYNGQQIPKYKAHW